MINMNRYDIAFIVVLALLLILFIETGLTKVVEPYIFVPLYACYLCGRYVGSLKPEEQSA
ncbi:MAG: hypothetical protein JJU46_13430 [Balneolaceae bacterium]|nr:hypothetical protein [Balneolaceae bacterium]MCH8547938.1 hypothetical protein [Balneolaceae bacterium]